MALNCKERIRPLANRINTTSQYGVSRLKLAQAPRLKPVNNALKVKVRRKPKRRTMRTASSLTTKAPTPPVKVSKPACKGLRPKHS
ncbi:hypothetical protein D3C76_1079020 [compost metagenome]